MNDEGRCAHDYGDARGICGRPKGHWIHVLGGEYFTRRMGLHAFVAPRLIRADGRLEADDRGL